MFRMRFSVFGKKVIEHASPIHLYHVLFKWIISTIRNSACLGGGGGEGVCPEVSGLPGRWSAQGCVSTLGGGWDPRPCEQNHRQV